MGRRVLLEEYVGSKIFMTTYGEWMNVTWGVAGIRKTHHFRTFL
jgi:hypothetical protein